MVAACGDYRVLRRLELPSGPCCTGGDTDTRIGLAVDTETTGLDPDQGHRIIELSIRRFRFDRDGVVTKLDTARGWLEDPGAPLDVAISQLTGLTDDDLAGRHIDDAAVAALCATAHVVVAFNAGFDRRFFERRFPALAGMPWACAMREVDWRARRCDGRSLGWLLAQCGFFHKGHRAGDDVDALIAILRHLDGAGRTAMAELVGTASRPGWRFRAVGAHFDVKGKLKARGYAWDGAERVWCREVPDHARDGEAAWLAAEVYAPEHRPRLDAPAVDAVDWCTRHG